MKIISRKNENIDALMWRTLGHTDGLATILEHNPHALKNAQLPAGVAITIPEKPISAAPRKRLTLWN